MKKLFLIALAVIIVFAVIQSNKSKEKPAEVGAPVISQVEDGSTYGSNVGEKAYNFTLQDLDGNSVSLADYEGSPVILVFGTTWCPYCKQEIPLLNALNNKYKAQGLKIISVDIKEPESKVRDFSLENGVSYTVVLDADSAVASDYKVYGIPLNLIIDKNGIIQYRGHIDQAKFENIINGLL